MSVEAIAEAMGIEYERAINTIWTGLKRSRKGSESWQYRTDADDQRRRWIVVETLPGMTRQCVEYHYGNDLVQQCHSERLLVEALALIEPDDRAWFLMQKPRKGGIGIPAEKAAQLAEACGWLRLSDSEFWATAWARRSEFFHSVVQVVAGRNLYGFKVSNGRVLERRLKRWQDEGRESLLPKNCGNCNAAKLCETQIKRIVSLYASPLKPSIQAVADIYNREAQERDWNTVDYERVRQILQFSDHRQIISLARHGKDAAKNELERTIKRRRPSFPDALWVGDGSTIQLYYKDKAGKVQSNLYAYAIIDAYSESIIGYAIGATETATLVQASLRDAVRKTGMTPYQLQYDNSSANKGQEAQQLFDQLARLHFPTAPYSGKAKVIEAIWGRMEQSNMRHFPNFKGGNITAKSRDARANPDFLANLMKSGELPSFDQVVAQFRLVVETMNNTVGKRDSRTPAERYRDANEQRTPMDYLTMVEAFWVERRNQVRYTKDGVGIEVDGKRYFYEVEVERGLESLEFRMKYLGDAFTVKYDPDDLEYICLYKDGVWIATARQKYEAPMARVDMLEGEGTIVSNSLTQRKAYWSQLQAEAESLENEMAALGFEPLNHRTLHKDAYNRMEGALLDELLEATAIGVESTKREKTRRFKLYDDTEADGSIVE